VPRLVSCPKCGHKFVVQRKNSPGQGADEGKFAPIGPVKQLILVTLLELDATVASLEMPGVTNKKIYTFVRDRLVEKYGLSYSQVVLGSELQGRMSDLLGRGLVAGFPNPLPGRYDELEGHYKTSRLYYRLSSEGLVVALRLAENGRDEFIWKGIAERCRTKKLKPRFEHADYRKMV